MYLYIAITLDGWPAAKGQKLWFYQKLSIIFNANK